MRIAEDLQLKLNPRKCKIFGYDMDIIHQAIESGPDTFRDLTIAGIPDDELENANDKEDSRGLKVHGIPIGNNKYIHHILKKRVDKIRANLENLTQMLSKKSTQILQAMIMYCYQPAFHHWIQCVNPDLTHPHAMEMDKLLTIAMRQTTGLDLYVENADTEDPCRFFTERFHLPTRLNGSGVRSITSIRIPTYMGNLMTVIPKMIDWQDSNGKLHAGLCKSLTKVIGGNSFTDNTTDWSTFINNSPDGRLFAKFWKEMQDQVNLAPEEHVSKILSSSADKAGNGQIYDSPRTLFQHALTAELEKATHARLLKEAIEMTDKLGADEFKDNFRNPNAMIRQYISFLQVDSISRIWMNQVPKKDTHLLSATDLHSAYATIFGQPDKLFAQHEGLKFLNRTLDPHGDHLALVNFQGTQHWNVVHTTVKLLIAKWLRIAEIPHTVEPYGLFTSCIPQAVYEGIPIPDRQALVPDFLIDERMCELKRIGPAFSHYKHTNARSRHQPVHTRAAQIVKEYSTKADKSDEAYNNTTQETAPGPIRTRLNEYLPGMLKFVFGTFYECSKDFHDLVKKITNTLAETKWRDQNFQSQHACRTFYSYVIQKDLSLCIVRQTCWMKRDRLGLACHNGASLTQRINQLARETNEVAIYEELYARRHGNRADNIVI